MNYSTKLNNGTTSNIGNLARERENGGEKNRAHKQCYYFIYSRKNDGKRKNDWNLLLTLNKFRILRGIVNEQLFRWSNSKTGKTGTAITTRNKSDERLSKGKRRNGTSHSPFYQVARVTITLLSNFHHKTWKRNAHAICTMRKHTNEPWMRPRTPLPISSAPFRWHGARPATLHCKHSATVQTHCSFRCIDRNDLSNCVATALNLCSDHITERFQQCILYMLRKPHSSRCVSAHTVAAHSFRHSLLFMRRVNLLIFYIVYIDRSTNLVHVFIICARSMP